MRVLLSLGSSNSCGPNRKGSWLVRVAFDTLCNDFVVACDMDFLVEHDDSIVARCVLLRLLDDGLGQVRDLERVGRNESAELLVLLQHLEPEVLEVLDLLIFSVRDML
jgi:hypothetical protein